MGRTGIVEYKAFLKVAKMFIFTLYSAKTQRLDQCLYFVLFIDEFENDFSRSFLRKVVFLSNYYILFLITKKGVELLCIFWNAIYEYASRRINWN